MSRTPAGRPVIDRKFAEVCARRRKVPDRWVEDFIQEVLVQAYGFVARGFSVRLSCWRAERAAWYALKKWQRDECETDDSAFSTLKKRRHKRDDCARTRKLRARWEAHKEGMAL